MVPYRRYKCNGMKPVLKVLLFALVILFGSRNCLLGADLPKYAGHVNDFANVLDSETKARLETLLTNFEARTGAQIAVATVTTLGDQPIEDYANALYR
ncbi:MAG: TPM domain-containing protein, partial [Acidobacteriota bacterium]